MSDGISEVRVEGARKRDAGRGIARLPTRIQSRLGVLSGDPIIIEGERLTVAKVWPSDDGGNVVRIDGDTRASIGANIGDYVTVRKASVNDAAEVTLHPASDHASEAPSEQIVRRKLVDRLVRSGKQLRIEEHDAAYADDVDGWKLEYDNSQQALDDSLRRFEATLEEQFDLYDAPDGRDEQSVRIPEESGWGTVADSLLEGPHRD